MRIFGGCGAEIRSVDEWFEKAPPKQGLRHWKDYRSAKELAKTWFRGAAAEPPEELLAFLHSLLPGEVQLTEAHAEYIVTLDRFGGEHRNTDLLVLGSAEGRRLAISVEAKADEPFGERIGKYYDQRLRVTGSNVPARIEGLCRTLFQCELNSRIRELRYQLLHAAAAARIAAEKHGADVAIFLVHEFVSERLNEKKRERNRNDWRAFVECVPVGIGLYLGKVETRLL